MPASSDEAATDSGAVVEPYLTDQWYLNVKPLAERALAAVKDGRTRIVPETWERTYFQGNRPDGKTGAADHQTRIRVKPFIRR